MSELLVCKALARFVRGMADQRMGRGERLGLNQVNSAMGTHADRRLTSVPL